ncbi:DNA-directed RNA polymerase subunit alpha [Striga asiatica]|uniref:DNA-directed RNA polymerase subunit alpha n=1 Tax=Striga asiatica TaxID=4170 RepID=A0A5A7RC61_STRAF|nr:DNA-directed RNA polymerase subunit alpha [Striga asiatica]
MALAILLIMIFFGFGYRHVNIMWILKRLLRVTCHLGETERVIDNTVMKTVFEFKLAGSRRKPDEFDVHKLGRMTLKCLPRVTTLPASQGPGSAWDSVHLCESRLIP